MANIRDAALEVDRPLKLPKRRRPYWVALARGLSLGYRRINTAGPWIVRSSDGKGGNRIQNSPSPTIMSNPMPTASLRFGRRRRQRAPLQVVAK